MPMYRCPGCGGNLFMVHKDEVGWHCLQCARDYGMALEALAGQCNPSDYAKGATIICEQCGKQVIVRSPSQRFCSDRCRMRASRERAQQRLTEQ